MKSKYIAKLKWLYRSRPKETTMKYVGKGDTPYSVYECSVCGTHIQNIEWYRYCPWCGAKIKAWA